MTRTRLLFALLGATALGVVATVAFWDGGPSAAPPPQPRVGTASVVKTNLVATTLTEGTLGYSPSGPVVNRLAGTYTSLPTPGAVIEPGQSLFAVDDLPVVLLSGATPAWRPFELGMSDGADVYQLDANLMAEGFATGLFSTPSDHFGALTLNAVERWQAARGLPVNGQVELGRVVFLPNPVLVASVSLATGQVASPGDVPFQASSTARSVVVAGNPDLPSVDVGERVSIVLPNGADTPGTVTAIGPGAASGGSGQGSGQSGSGQSGSGQSSSGGSNNQSGGSQSSSAVTITPEHPAETGSGAGIAVQVSLVTQSATDVLAVPIAALLALAGGGYGVEVLDNGGHHLVGVTTGLFTGSQVQIWGWGIRAGETVTVAQ